MIACRTEAVHMDLADFLASKLAQSNYRDLEVATGVSRGSLEAIIKRETKSLPEIKTLGKIARAYHKPLWEIMRLAGVDLELPKDVTELSKRLAGLVEREPAVERLVDKLVRRFDTDPDHVTGILIGLEAALGPNGDAMQ